MLRLATALAAASLLAIAVPGSAATANTCVITVSMTTGAEVNNLDFILNYVGLDAGIEGTATRPDCVRALGGAFAGFHDDDAGHLSVAVIRLAHFSAPTDLIACRISYDTAPPEPAEFIVTVTNAARDGQDNNVQPTPHLQVSDIECPGEFPAVTTTTLPEETTTTLAGGGRCGFPVTDGVHPAAADALAALRAAIGLRECELCVCDINGNGKVATSDALGILRAAVGIETPLDCPAC